jgi:ATP-dependent RNA helicase DDX19/DBP5
MTAEGHKVASLHGAKDAAERDAIIDNFREGRDKVCCPVPYINVTLF